MNSKKLKLRKEFADYAERMAEIKRLSSPDIKKSDSADTYSIRLTNNFKRIGELAAINREMLDRDLYPLLESDEQLEEDIIEELESLSEKLLDITGNEDAFDTLDLPITALISERLLKDASEKNDINAKIRRMNEEIDVYYSLFNMLIRIRNDASAVSSYREKAIDLCNEFFSLLDKDVFLTISDPECREIVLTNCRFSPSFYEGTKTFEYNQKILDIQDKMLAISYDEFYIEAVPDFDWDYYRFRIYEYYTQFTAVNNASMYTPEQLELICERVETFENLYLADDRYISRIYGSGFDGVNILRCKYLAGRIEKKEYFDELIELYLGRDKKDVSLDGVYYNINLPLEIVCLIDTENISAYEMDLFDMIYHAINAYAFDVPSGETMIAMLEYFAEIVKRYSDIPGSISFPEFMLKCLAAIHPPTYVHSKMVGLISERICFHLIHFMPELLVGMFGIESVDEVHDHMNEILHFVYNAAVCHDFGKIFIIDTILVYGRKLLDFEFNLIKTHPETGYNILIEHESTREYADIALFHHKWFDDSKGYPFDKKSSESKYKNIIDLVMCADCLDAATDTVGRSYNKGKTVEDYMVELQEGSGTRYAPWLYDLFNHEEVIQDLNYLLNEGRKKNYRETYNLLRGTRDDV